MSQKLVIFCPYSDTKTHRNTIKHTPNPKHAQKMGIFCPFCYHFCHEFTRLRRFRLHALSHTPVNVRKNTNEQTSSHATHILYKMTLANPASMRGLEKLWRSVQNEHKKHALFLCDCSSISVRISVLFYATQYAHGKISTGKKKSIRVGDAAAVSIADNPLLCSAPHSVLTHATEIKWRKIIFVNDFTFIFKQ